MNTNTKNEINNLWKKNIYEAVKDISDIESQRMIWLGKNADYESSYDEYMMALYDDFSFNDFILESNWRNTGLSQHLLAELKNLDVLLHLFNKNRSDIEILNDLEWHKIVKQAKEVITVWDSEQ